MSEMVRLECWDVWIWNSYTIILFLLFMPYLYLYRKKKAKVVWYSKFSNSSKNWYVPPKLPVSTGNTSQEREHYFSSNFIGVLNNQSFIQLCTAVSVSGCIKAILALFLILVLFLAKFCVYVNICNYSCSVSHIMLKFNVSFKTEFWL